MEEQVDGSCSVVYLCTSAQDDVSELYHSSSPPQVTVGTGSLSGWKERILENVSALLDEDRGGFEEVFVASSRERCVDQLENYASRLPTVLLIEVLPSSSARRQSQDQHADQEPNTIPLLRALTVDIQGARYQKPVMMFAVVVSESLNGAVPPVDMSTASECLNAGALEVLSSPFESRDVSHLLGHVTEQTKPPARLLGAAMAQNLVDSIRNQNAPSEPCHRPDQTVPLDRRKAVEEAVGQWHFKASDFDWDELTCAVMFMLEHMLSDQRLSTYSIPRSEIVSFLLATRRQYKHERQVRYHNWRHAVDVTQSLYCFLVAIELCPPKDSQPNRKELTGIEKLLTPLDGLILLISAIGHDVGHPGVNNAFLVACNHPLAQMYNDKSVLENYHCAAYSQLLRRHWPSLSNIAGFRATMISNILATDMQRHFEYMGSLGDFKERVAGSDADVRHWNEKDKEHARELLMALMMKAADISNVARPFDVSATWAKILLSEFTRQGELEYELDIPTCLFGGPPKKDDLLAAAQSQQGFINLFGYPLFHGISEVVPSMTYAVDCLTANKAMWEQRIKEEERRRDNEGEERSHLTFSSVSENEVAEAKHRQSEPMVVPSELAQDPSAPINREATRNPEGSPARHPASDLKRHLMHSFANAEDRHSGYSLLSSAHTSPLGGGGSRRSSKDAALDSLQQLSIFTHQSINAGSRRGSNASASLQKNFSTSRRGSKDESLTTILVTSGGGSPARSSRSPGDTSTRNDSPTKAYPSSKRQSAAAPSRSQKQQSVASTSVPSSRSHATSSATAATSEPSPSTQASSLAHMEDNEDEPTPPAHHASIAATEDPFVVPGNWPNDLDGTHRASAPVALPATPPPHNVGAGSVQEPSEIVKSDSPQKVSSMASGESEKAQRLSSRKASEPVIRESRSRSRLRGLKFWKKKKEPSGSGSGSGATAPEAADAASP